MSHTTTATYSCSGAFTQTCGSGYRKFDNPQVSFCLSTLPQLASSVDKNDTKNKLLLVLQSIKISFELRRVMPLSSKHHSEGIGFSIFEIDNGRKNQDGSRDRRINTKLCDNKLIAHSEFHNSDVMRLALDASHFFGSSAASLPQEEKNCYFIAVLYSNTPGIEADFRFSIVVAEPQLQQEQQDDLLSHQRIRVGSSASPQPPPPPSQTSSSSPGVTAVGEQQNGEDNNHRHQQHDNDGEESVEPPPLLEEEDEQEARADDHNLSSSEPSHCDEPLLSHDDDDDDDDDDDTSPSPPNRHSLLRCRNLNALPECFRLLEHDEESLMIGEGAAGYGDAANPQFALLLVLPTVADSSSGRWHSAETNITANITMEVAPLTTSQRQKWEEEHHDVEKRSGRCCSPAAADFVFGSSDHHHHHHHHHHHNTHGGTKTPGIRFFVAQATPDEEEGREAERIAAGGGRVERLRGYFPTGEPETTRRNRKNKNKNKNKNKTRLPISPISSPSSVTKKSNNNKDDDDDDDDDETSTLASSSDSEYEQHDEYHFSSSSSSSSSSVQHQQPRSKQHETITTRDGSGRHKIRVFRSPFVETMRVSLEGVPIFDSSSTGTTTKDKTKKVIILHRIMACCLKQGFECCVKMSVKLFPSSSSSFLLSSSSPPSCLKQQQQCRLVALDAFRDRRFERREFAEYFTGAKWSTHAVYDSLTFSRFLPCADARAIVDRINERCSGSSSSLCFHDPHFPPHCQHSLNSPTCVLSSSPSTSSPSTSSTSPYRVKPPLPQHLHLDDRWRRPIEFCPQTPVLFSTSTTTTKLRQGLVGDCWLAASMDATASARPGHLRNIIYPASSSSSSSGTAASTSAYAVSLFVDGDWYAVIVDDFIPCKRGKPAFARCADRSEIGIAIIEKMFAKIFGGYNELAAGAPIESACEMLTGGVGGVVFFRNAPSLADLVSGRMVEYVRNRWPMCVSSDRPKEENEEDDEWDDETVRNSGIVSNHGYSVLDVVADNDGMMMSSSAARVKLRNPWSHTRWVKKNKKKANKKTTNKDADDDDDDDDDGSFWMDLEDLVIEFDYVTFCRVTSDVFPVRHRLLVVDVDPFSSKWQKDPSLNVQVVLEIPQDLSSNNGKNSFARLRVSVDPVGCRGGGFHLHILPVDALEALQPGPPMGMTPIPASATQEVETCVADIVVLSAGNKKSSAAAASTSTTTSSSSSTSQQKKFFLTHDLIQQHQLAHTEGYFQAVFESDAVTNRVFEKGRRYLLVAYRIGDGFDGGFCFSVEGTTTTTTTTSLPCCCAVLTPPPILASHQEKFALVCNYRSTLNPQFLIENCSSKFAIAVNIGCELLLLTDNEGDGHDENSNNNNATQQPLGTNDDYNVVVEPGLEILLLRFPPQQQQQQQQQQHSPPRVLLGGRTQVENNLVDQSPFYRARAVSLTTQLPPCSRFIVMPSRGCGTETRVAMTVKGRVGVGMDAIRFEKLG